LLRQVFPPEQVQDGVDEFRFCFRLVGTRHFGEIGPVTLYVPGEVSGRRGIHPAVVRELANAVFEGHGQKGFIELDLAGLIGELPPPVPAGADPQHWLRVFLLLFSRDALVPEGPGGNTFLDLVLDEGRRYEQRVTEASRSAISRGQRMFAP